MFKYGLKWFGILILVSVLGVLGISYYVKLYSDPYIVREAEAMPEADAVLVLGAYVHGDGSPSMVLADRLEYGYRLYELKKVKKILVSGDHGGVHYDEVNNMKNYLIAKGVPKEDIFMDHAGFDTYDSMYRAKHIFGIERLIISTQEFHIHRSIYIARSLGIDAYGFPSPNKEIYKMTYMNAREMLAHVKAVLETDVLHRKPRFLGEPIPISGDGSVTDDWDR